MKDIIYVFVAVIATRVPTFVKTHQTVHLKRMCFAICKSYFNKTEACFYRKGGHTETRNLLNGFKRRPEPIGKIGRLEHSTETKKEKARRTNTFRLAFS